VDFDGDGILDLISGSYDPGHFYLFRGKGKGEYLAQETITDKNGKPIVTNTKMTEPVESFGSWVAMVDWRNKGVLDLVLGTYDGHILVRLNEGTRTKPAFATENIDVLADGKPLHVPGHHATPVIATGMAMACGTFSPAATTAASISTATSASWASQSLLPRWCWFRRMSASGITNSSTSMKNPSRASVRKSAWRTSMATASWTSSWATSVPTSCPVPT
jgi:hypothetical protein